MGASRQNDRPGGPKSATTACRPELTRRGGLSPSGDSGSAAPSLVQSLGKCGIGQAWTGKPTAACTPLESPSCADSWRTRPGRLAASSRALTPGTHRSVAPAVVTLPGTIAVRKANSPADPADSASARTSGARNIAGKHLAGVARGDPGGPPSTGPVSADPGGQGVGLGRRQFPHPCPPAAIRWHRRGEKGHQPGLVGGPLSHHGRSGAVGVAGFEPATS